MFPSVRDVLCPVLVMDWNIYFYLLFESCKMYLKLGCLSQNPALPILHHTRLPFFTAGQPWLLHLEAAPSCRLVAWAPWARHGACQGHHWTTTGAPNLHPAFPELTALRALSGPSSKGKLKAALPGPGPALHPCRWALGGSGGDTAQVPLRSAMLNPLGVLRGLSALQNHHSSELFPLLRGFR